MVLVIFLLFPLLFLFQIRVSVFFLLKPASEIVHNLCLDRILSDSTASAELGALVCGENFFSHHAVLYQASGLIHLFVVSGTHLCLLEKLLFFIFSERSKTSQVITLILLFIFVLACQMNPPSVRSFISLAIGFALLRFHLNWNETFRVLISTLICLIINPQWITSLSLQLSFIAGLLLALQKTSVKDLSLFAKQSIFFIGLYPILLCLQVTRPVSILFNLIWAPVLEFILFPVALACWLFPFFTFAFEKLLDFFVVLLKRSELIMLAKPDLDFLQMGTTLPWIYIFLIQIIAHILELSSRRSDRV